MTIDIGLIARALTGTFAGIGAAGVVAFIAAQLAGMLTAVAVASWLCPSEAMSKGLWRRRD
jgi:hypothetical protein